jgi:DNA-binding transcriptional ArsR family regulator
VPDSNNVNVSHEETRHQAPKREKKTCVVITDPEIIKILLDEKRKTILSVLREGIVRKSPDSGEDLPRSFAMTAIEIVEKLTMKNLSIKKSAVYFHLDKLESANLIEVARKEQKKRSQITYYRRTAPIFLISYQDAPEVKEEVMKDYGKKEEAYIEYLIQSYVPDATPELKERVKVLMNELKSFYEDFQYQISEKMIGEIPENKAVKIFHSGIEIITAGNKRYHEISSELSKLLFNM